MAAEMSRAGESLLGGDAIYPRPRIEDMAADWDRFGRAHAVANDRTCCERFTGLFLGLGVAALISTAMIVASTIDENGGLLAWQIAVGTVLAVASLCVLPCMYSPGLEAVSSRVKATPVAIPGASATGQTLPYRSTRVDALVMTKSYPAGTATTLRELWELTSSAHASKPCFGARKVKGQYHVMKSVPGPDGTPREKKFLRKVFDNEFSFITYGEAADTVRGRARALHALMERHHPAAHSEDEPRHAAIYSASRVEWQLAAQACFRAGIPMATVYNTLGKDGLAYAVNLTAATVLFVERDTLRTVAAVALEGAAVLHPDGREEEMDLSCVKCIVLLDSPADSDLEADVGRLRMRGVARGGPVEVLWDRELDSAARSLTAESEPPSPGPDDTAVIMYTSGSTGLPKGVNVLHRNLVACAAGLGGCLPQLGPDDSWLAYLPSSHILELAAELCFIAAGGSLGYGSPFSLTAASPLIPQPGDVDTAGRERTDRVVGDAVALKPTVMACVPAVVGRIRKGVMGQIEKASALRKWLATTALETGTRLYPQGKAVPFFDGLVFDALRKRVLGGRVRMIASGGGPLSADAQLWMNVVMRCPMRQGYGLTETCGGGTLQWTDDRSTLRVGPPILSNDIKLVDWEEGDYLTSRHPPRGEICIAGGNVTAGYYKEPAKTAEAFVEEDGRIWFRTGDVGQFDDDGVLRIIDRKKDLVKLDKGEYISLGKMESVFSGVNGVANIVCFGKPTQAYSVAVVIVDEAALPEELRRPSERAYVGDAAVTKHIHGLIQAKAKDCHFSNKGEIPSRVYVAGSTAWLPPSGMVTASMKIQRKKVDRYYAAAYAFLYDEATDPQAEIAAKVPASV